MTLTEKTAWMSLGAGLLVLGYLVANLTDGFSIPDQATRHLWRTWWFALGLGVIGEALVGWYFSRAQKRGSLVDERDQSITLRAERVGFYTFVCAINIGVWQLLWEETLQGHALPKIDLTHTPTLFLALMGTIWISYLAKHVATIVLSRR